MATWSGTPSTSQLGTAFGSKPSPSGPFNSITTPTMQNAPATGQPSWSSTPRAGQLINLTYGNTV